MKRVMAVILVLGMGLFLAFSCSHQIVLHTPLETELTLRLPASMSEEDCLSAILKIINNPSKKLTKTDSQGVFRYPHDLKNIKDNHIQYGFEVEYTMDEAKVIFNNYMPDKTIFKKSREEWLAMNYYDQLRFFDSHYKEIYPKGSRFPGKMTKITQGAMAKYLSDDLISDSGNFELVYKPFDTLEELFETIKNSKKLLGAGSMQIMISNPIDKHGLKTNTKLFKKKFEEELGYYNFVNELDTLEKLAGGYAKYKSNPTLAAASSFAHPWLGPMTKHKNIRLKKFLEMTYKNDSNLDRELDDYGYQVTSNKFIGGLAFRPDVARLKGRVASEVRDCHRNLNCIESRAKRETYFLMKGKSKFQMFSKLEAFDSVVVPLNTNPKVMEMLKELFPAFNNMKIVEVEMYRNFTYPLRNWNGHLKLLAREDLTNTVSLAQQKYLEELLKINTNYKMKTITARQARLQIMGALVHFAHESKLYEAFKSHYNQLLPPSELKEFQDIHVTTYFIENRVYVRQIQTA